MAARRPAGWISADEAGEQLRRQADATMRALGHVPSGWYAFPTGDHVGQIWSVCMLCDEKARVAPRHLDRVPFRGVALALRCRGKRS